MSSSFIYCYFKVRANQDLKKTKQSMLSALKDNIERGIINSKNQEVMSFYENTTGDYPKEDEKSWNKMSQTIENLFQVIDDDYDVGCIYHYGWNIYFAGGMSWGGDPSDSFTAFNNFTCLPKCILKAGCIRF